MLRSLGTYCGFVFIAEVLIPVHFMLKRGCGCGDRVLSALEGAGILFLGMRRNREAAQIESHAGENMRSQERK